MERLTNHFDYCEFIECKWRDSELEKVDKCKFFDATSRNKCHEKSVYEKLRAYEDLEEQGLLLRLPCKVGDTFWELNNQFTKPTIYPRKVHSISHCVYVLERLGKICFLTKAEAEKALAEMG